MCVCVCVCVCVCLCVRACVCVCVCACCNDISFLEDTSILFMTDGVLLKEVEQVTSFKSLTIVLTLTPISATRRTLC